MKQSIFDLINASNTVLNIRTALLQCLPSIALSTVFGPRMLASATRSESPDSAKRFPITARNAHAM